MKKPLILVTNDDGVNAPGLNTLVRLMSEIGDVIVVAPDSPQSGMGHAITIDATLYVNKIEDHKTAAIEVYSTSGTPSDCVKLAIREILDRKPDLVVSGINHGSNASINVIYSGTMSAAIEAGIEGIPSIGFSLCDYKWEADFRPFEPYITTIVKKSIKNGIPKNTILNVNAPKTTTIKGIKICRQAKANWVEKFDKRTNPQGKNYYWLTGEFLLEDQGEDTDEWAIANDYIAIVPVQFDLTAHHQIQTLNNWNLNE